MTSSAGRGRRGGCRTCSVMSPCGTPAAPRWEKDGISVLGIKSYDQGRPKWQGATLDFVWFDEEPPEDVYVEGLSRTNATGGIVWITMTPLQGMTALLQSFYDECGDGSA